MDVFERLKPIFKTVVGQDVELETTMESLYLDELDLLDLVNRIEEEYVIDINDDVALGWNTVDEIVESIHRSF